MMLLVWFWAGTIRDGGLWVMSESSTLGPIMVMTVELIALLLLLSTTVEISGFQGPLLPSRLLPLMAPIAYIS